ncbi:helix-turn-helix transcriptional regulator [Pedobacter frigidisoli]|uniref:helix-turn-helix transcriptional regulator n=1 Tax=Pedobacter frigidisoli TaxID=2530455 RepID=UPI00292F0EC0|nr:helix-turn-helix transcriptional regulator [Pedobacter frigidisoli]
MQAENNSKEDISSIVLQTKKATSAGQTLRHEGHMVERIIRRNRMGISEIARKMNVSRRTLYNWFESDCISTENIHKLAQIIDHDFSVEFPNKLRIYHEIDSIKSLLENKNLDRGDNESVYYWMDRYIKLLENFNEILQGNQH